jgi:hypothetical protein
MTVNTVGLENLDDDTRVRYLSAKSMQQNPFWKELLANLDHESFNALSACHTFILKGQTDKAMVEAGKVEGFNWLLMQFKMAVDDVDRELSDQREEQ